MRLTYRQSDALDALDDKITTELLFGGGAGGGKSIVGCFWLLKMCIKYPGTRWVMGRKELKTLKDTTLVSFYKVSKMQGYSRFSFNGQTNVITFRNGSIILLKDLAYYPSDPLYDSLGSLEITGAFVDEVGQITNKAKDILKSRIRHGLDENGLVPKLFMSGNPAKNWTYKDFFDANRKGTIKPYRKFIQSLVTDNPNISKHYIENLKQIKDVATTQRLLYGNWDYDDDPTQLITYQNIVNSYTNSYVDKGERYLTCDIAMEGSDKFVVAYWDGWRLENMYSFTKLKANVIEAKIKELAEFHCVARSNVIYDADGLGQYLRGYLSGARGFVNNSKAQNRENYSNLKSQCAYRIADKFKNNAIYMNIEECYKEGLEEEIQAACRSWKADDDGRVSIIPKKVVKDRLGFSPDYWDAIMMRGIDIQEQCVLTIM